MGEISGAVHRTSIVLGWLVGLLVGQPAGLVFWLVGRYLVGWFLDESVCQPVGWFVGLLGRLVSPSIGSSVCLSVCHAPLSLQNFRWTPPICLKAFFKCDRTSRDLVLLNTRA